MHCIFHCTKVVSSEKIGLKMFQKKYFSVSVFLIYMFLVILFFKLQRKYSVSSDDSFYFDVEPCVRFCCKNKELCDQKYIDDHFNASLLPYDEFWDWNETQGVKAYFGQPDCTLNEISSQDVWEFKAVN